MERFHSFVASWKGVAALIATVLVIITWFSTGVDTKIDNKIIQHERNFELKQQKVVGEIQRNVATLNENSRSQQRQLDAIQEQGKHTQELVEQLIREID